MEAYQSFSEVVDVISNLVSKKASGTLFIRSESNSSASFGLDAGRITSIYYGLQHGMKAVPLIRDIPAGNYRFEPSILNKILQDLPNARELIDQLRQSPSDEPSEPKSQVPANRANILINEEDRKALCRNLKRLLTEHLGPIANLVFDDTMAEAGDFCATLEMALAFISKLACEIGDPTEMEQFKSKASAAIKNAMKS